MQHNKPTHQTKIHRHRTPSAAPEIAIIVRTKDRPHLLTRCLQSLAEQKRRPDEVILVNDGGVTIDHIVSEFSDLNIRFINNTTNQGRSRAGNQGAQATACDIIGFLDDDDRFLPDHLQRAEKALLHFDAGVVYSGCRLLKRDMLGDKIILQEKAIGQFNDPYDAERLRYENYIPLINLLITRSLWLQVGGFDDSFEVFEDWDVLQRLSLHTSFYHINRITTEYAVWGPHQITQQMKQQRWREAYRQVLKKHLIPLPETEQLNLLSEYWRVSQERRSLVQDTSEEKQALQLQLLQNTQSLEQLHQQLSQYQAQNGRLQQEQSQLQTDWSNKYDRLQSNYTQLQADWAKKYEQLQSNSAKEQAQSQADWTAKYQQLQSNYAQLQADWTAKYQQLQSDYTQLQSDWVTKYQQLQTETTKEKAQLQTEWQQKHQQLQSDSAEEKTQLQTEWQQKYQQLQSDSAEEKAQLQSEHATQYIQLEAQIAEQQQQLTELQERSFQWQSAFQQQQQHSQSLQQALHELSKQMAVGLNQPAVERILQSQPTAYALATSTGGVLEDYQRLVNWIRDKAKQLAKLDQQLQAQTEPLYTEYHQLRTQSANLIQLIQASHWPQVRRYAHAVQEIDKTAEQLFSVTEQTVSLSAHIGTQIGLTPAITRPQTNEIPPARQLSEVYPTFTSLAGTEEHPQFMENVKELGTVPFMLDAGVALVFTVYCTLDNFYRLDILLATRLRINTCQVRLIIRDLNSKTVLRVVHQDAIELFDNRFQAFRFEPITESAGKTYQIEIDSPDANKHSGIAVWSHPKQPQTHYAQQLPETTTQRSPQTLPHWVQQSLLDLPLSARLRTKSAPHLFLVGGITESTPVFDLHRFLGQISHALKQADANGQVIVYGQLSPKLQHYCQQQQITTLDPTQLAIDCTQPHLIDLPKLLEWGKTHLKSQSIIKNNVQSALTAEYLWCCQLDALPQTDIVERAIEIITAHPEAGLLVPLEKHTNGKIRAGYASLVRDGLLQTHCAGAPADHPYHAYRRTIEAASSQLVIMKAAKLIHIDISDISAYHTPMYQLTELIWQLKEQQSKTLYEGSMLYEYDQPYPKVTDADYNHDSHRFYQRWSDKLSSHTAPFDHLGELLNPYGQPTVLVIDATLPMYDEDSGSLRLHTLLKIWASLGYRITFIADNLDSQFKYRHALEALGIEVFHGEYRIADAMAYRQFDFAFICRVEVGHRYIPFVRLLSPKTVIFYDTVDIHFIREQRQAEIENDPGLIALAQETKRKELYNCKMADKVITVTEEDGYHLQEELPYLTFSVIPNIHRLQPLPETSFEQRDGLVFIGNYDHTPNEDAMYYFIDNVLPKIHACLPNVSLYLIGSNMKDKMKALASDDVKVIGWVDQVEPEFAKRRVFVSYLRYGAGMKGKLGQALSLGLPVITTHIGAEGMGLIEEETALIADEPESFAEAVCRLYTDSVLWEKLSRQGREYIEQHFGETAVREKLQNLLECEPNNSE